jgi:FtsP/CotA-like multicopper oxidase with cupredoxin domain
MPRAGVVREADGTEVDYYEISVRQFEQQILPDGLPATTVWGYGPVARESDAGLMVHNAPSLTIEAATGRPVRVKWINELVDANGDFLPHLLPVDPTLHWANPGGGESARDTRPEFTTAPTPYQGPVPMVTHVHGAVGVGDESDGYPEAWYLPAARNLPEGFAAEGTWYGFFADKAKREFGVEWEPGSAVFQYPNTGRAATNWYHDHTLGLTRVNVYAGPAGFFLLRGGASDEVLDARTGEPAVLPGPAPKPGDPFPATERYLEIPIAIQDRSFYEDGSLRYPESREEFDGIAGPYLPEVEGGAHDGIAPIWNPEMFGDTLIVNGRTWPYLDVVARRYRLRLLNGCQSRALILDFSRIPGIRVWQLGTEGGYLKAPVDLAAANALHVLLGPAERADLIVDFGAVPEGEHVLHNLGPDEPFGGGVPGEDFEPADPERTGLVLQFRVGPADGEDLSTPPEHLQLPVQPAVPGPTMTRRLALIELMGAGVDRDGNPVEGPAEAVLGTADGGWPLERSWDDLITENPVVGETETWELYNTTADAHPIHLHETVFHVIDRETLQMDGEDVVLPLVPTGDVRPPEPWEAGPKDTVLAYPGEVTRIRATFGRAGQYVWHCHILEHEDNEMMRPYRIGPEQPGQPAPKP